MNDNIENQQEAMTESKFKLMLLKALEIAEAEFGSDIPLSALIILLKMNTKGATPMTQITKSSKLSPAGSNRSVSAMAGFSKASRREIAKPILNMYDDPMDRRYKMVEFTDHGKHFMNRLVSVIY